jgi:hypothetical protein
MSKELNFDTHCKVLRGEVVSRECKPKDWIILRCVLTNMVNIYIGRDGAEAVTQDEEIKT